VDREDTLPKRRRRDSSPEERCNLLWERTPSPQDDGRHSPSPLQYDTEGPHHGRFRNLPAHLRMGSRERATDAPPYSFAEIRDRPTHTRSRRYDVRGRTTLPTLWDMPHCPHTSPTGFTEGRPCVNVTTEGDKGVGQGGAKNPPHYPGGQENMRNVPYDHAGQHGARNLSHNGNVHRTTMEREDPRDTYPSRHDAGNNIPRGTVPDVNMRSTPDMNSQQKRDLTSIVSQLASEFQLFKDNLMPPATAADNDCPSPLTPDIVGHPPAVVSVPLPIPPVVPTGEPVHYDSGPRPTKQHIVKLESYASQGASFEAFLEKYEEHSRYYKWNDDDRVFHLKNCLTRTAATVLWARGKKATATQLIALLQNRHGTANQLERFCPTHGDASRWVKTRPFRTA